MSVSSSRDPVKTLLDILNNTSDSDYTGSKPGTIERMEDSSWNIKVERTGDALYVGTPADGDMSQFAADTSAYDESKIVQVEAWTPTDSATAFEIATDLVDHIWKNYGQDNHASTNWHRIQPVTSVDYRDEARSDRATQYRAGFQVELTDVREP